MKAPRLLKRPLGGRRLPYGPKALLRRLVGCQSRRQMCCSGTSVSWLSVCFSSSSVNDSKSPLRAPPKLWPTRYRSRSSDLIVLDTLHAGDDDEVHDRSLGFLLTDLMLRLFDKARP